jgi:hypothetical protein
VGSDCVARTYRKVGEEVPSSIADAKRQLARDKREAKRAIVREQNMARWAAAREALATHPDLLTDQPHQCAYMADKGLTMRDYATWMLNDGYSASGRNAVARLIESTITVEGR